MAKFCAGFRGKQMQPWDIKQLWLRGKPRCRRPRERTQTVVFHEVWGQREVLWEKCSRRNSNYGHSSDSTGAALTLSECLPRRRASHADIQVTAGPLLWARDPGFK